MSQPIRLALKKALLTLCCLIVSGAATTFGQVSAPSDGGNTFLHAIGWQTFSNAGANNSTGISDSTPDSNSTFDATPVGSNNGGLYLTGTIGPGASILGRTGLGQSSDSSFLNGQTFGEATGNNGLNIVDVTLADGSAGARIGPQGQSGASSWRFQTNGNQEFGDFSITNESDFEFRLERIHYDARSVNANAPQDLDIIYLASGESNLIRVGGFAPGTEVPDLHVISDIAFPSPESNPNVHNVSASVAASFVEPTAVRLGPGETASFRFRWTNSITDFAQSQIDNLAISGTFQDQNNGFASINPVDVLATPVVKGDVDMDGDVDFADIPAFIAVLQSGVFQAEADCDCSTAVDFADIPAFIAILQGQ